MPSEPHKLSMHVFESRCNVFFTLMDTQDKHTSFYADDRNKIQSILVGTFAHNALTNLHTFTNNIIYP